MAKKNLGVAKKTKFDEFYTQFNDIQSEINAYTEYNPDVFKGKTILLPCDDPEYSNFTKFFAQNFERFGLKKLISTSYAHNSKNLNEPYQLTLFESESPQYNNKKTKSNGKIFVLDGDKDKSGKIDIEDLEWNYLEGDGDFRSEEITKICEDVDIVITNPPFSLFREFILWLITNNKKFLIIGNMNSVTYKEVFPLIKNNKLWVGYNQGGSRKGNSMFFKVPKSYTNKYVETDAGIRLMQTSAWWFTNLEHGRRHQPLQLMTMKDNLKFSKHVEIKKLGYPKYDNYDAIDVSYTDAIPSDYVGTMGVPISFLPKYNPDQFEIVKFRKGDDEKDLTINGVSPYFRILIRWKKNAPGFIDNKGDK